ncbi:uncharacterized protein LOC124943363 [Impatiens glandulifera]|uniref:uncharacterized protein LOC124943320 n=1 Tax=Impatiens glandulifera TaxID=253017 RepID=UPI001FB09B6E|nr:uncharacterized protein LOC124943320 [Impatiens glandulifera]XP_047339835.1 uncharacterized protein LOC124943363 [Impatiens glandulifera]
MKSRNLGFQILILPFHKQSVVRFRLVFGWFCFNPRSITKQTRLSTRKPKTVEFYGVRPTAIDGDALPLIEEFLSGIQGFLSVRFEKCHPQVRSYAYSRHVEELYKRYKGKFMFHAFYPFARKCSNYRVFTLWMHHLRLFQQ